MKRFCIYQESYNYQKLLETLKEKHPSFPWADKGPYPHGEHSDSIGQVVVRNAPRTRRLR